MFKKNLSRREFLRIVGASGAGVVASGLANKALASNFALPAFVRQVGDLDLSDPAKVGEALKAEGASVKIHTWGFSGLRETVFVDQFAKYTEDLYGVAVKLEYADGDFTSFMTELPLANRKISDLGIDVIDKEEEYFSRISALEWNEPIDQDQYKPLLTNVPTVEKPYVFTGEKAVNGSSTYGLVYQGYEWLQALIRKDKVNAADFKDWTDLARPEMTAKGISYSLSNDSRGHFVFLGMMNSLVKQGIITGDLWDIATWEAGFEWWKANMEKQIFKYGDMGNDPTMRLSLQSGEAWWGGLWGSYTRELLATDWNKRDDMLAPFYPASGIVADRETLSAVAGAAHPVAARILINWFLSTEFQHAGWYKETPDAEAINHWNITEDKYLVVYCGGVSPEHRVAMPDWAKPYYAEDPGKLLITVNWDWYIPNAETISRAYDRISAG
ncbi:MAG: extracellular solute-binding protein [Anaerolineae bacterium]|nr:extracellular solute-binding protein [Anaerolineae bacterium]